MVYYRYRLGERVRFRKTIDPRDKEFVVVSVEETTGTHSPAGHYQWIKLDNGKTYSSSFFEKGRNPW